MPHETFRYRSTEELHNKALELGLNLPIQDSITPLLEPVNIGSKTVPNRIAVHPMEGFDSKSDGSPGKSAFRRYGRYASGGNGMIQFEATAITQDGRSNPGQLLLNEKNLDSFKQLVDHTRSEARLEFGDTHDPFLVLQITHSGRYSKPDGKPLNKVAAYNPNLDHDREKLNFFSDAELDELKETYIKAVILTKQAGFDAVDIKACHGYLLHELLGSHTREDSKYGGSFENRTRFLLEVVEAAHREAPEMVTAVRLNATDGIAFPYGFGVPEDGTPYIDLSEPKLLIRQLIAMGCSLINITTGIPYHSPQLVRPFDRPVKGTSIPEEHPLEGVMRMVNIAGELQHEFPETPIVGTGYSWLRHYYPYVGAAVLNSGNAALIGLGRNSFAYPDSPKDLMELGELNLRKSCVTCSKCTELMRMGRKTGCVTRDTDIYLREYKRKD
ncbi:MAG: hypothetical protein HN356_09040 [Calditrichaeota bacterium]|nr:hypothetical protein [Calditrichota bacterium]MBT7787666.1 hypothetical protein [Calditrichota bacterium]